jgi:hypothetical protein
MTSDDEKRKWKSNKDTGSFIKNDKSRPQGAAFIRNT